MGVRIGVIGAGGIARAHIPSFARLGAQFVGFCDVVLDRARELAEQHGGVATTDFRELYDAQPEGVLICVPPSAHGEVELEACKRGIHMFVEKPVCLDMDTARTIEAAVEESGVATVVGYKYRWDGFVRKARSLLAERPAAMVVGWFWTSMPGGPWWRRMEDSGGQFVEQTTHIVDLARYLVGDIVNVQAVVATAGTYDPPSNVPDAYLANFVFESGAIGSITSTCMLTGWGSSGLRAMAPGLTVEVMHPRVTWVDETGEHSDNGDRDGYLGEAEAFVRAIEGDRSDIASDWADGAKSLAATLAVNKSASLGGAWVDPRTL